MSSAEIAFVEYSHKRGITGAAYMALREAFMAGFDATRPAATSESVVSADGVSEASVQRVLKYALGRMSEVDSPDQIRNLFESAFLSENGHHTKAELAKEWAYPALSGIMFRAGVEAANIAITRPAATSNEAAPEVVLKRTEQIRLAHANPVVRSRALLIRDVEQLLAHIAFTNTATPAPTGEAVQPDAAMGSLFYSLRALTDWAEAAAVKIEGEFGIGRSLEEIIAAGDLAEEITNARTLLDGPAATPALIGPYEAVYCDLRGCEPHGLSVCDDFKQWKHDLFAIPALPNAKDVFLTFKGKLIAGYGMHIVSNDDGTLTVRPRATPALLGLSDTQIQTLTSIAEWLTSSTNMVQVGPEEQSWASEFDMQLAQAADEISAIIAALKEAP